MSTHSKKDLDEVVKPPVNLQDVNRLLEVGKLLSSVLTEEERKALQDAMMTDPAQECLTSSEIGNTSVS